MLQYNIKFQFKNTERQQNVFYLKKKNNTIPCVHLQLIARISLCLCDAHKSVLQERLSRCYGKLSCEMEICS